MASTLLTNRNSYQDTKILNTFSGGDEKPRKYFQTKKKNPIARLFSIAKHSDKDHIGLDSPMIFTEDDVLMEGYLTKLSNSKYFQNKQTYFILRSDTWSLCQYKSQTDLTLLHETSISRHDIVRDVSDIAKAPYTFEILRPDYPRPLRLSCQDSRLLERWICAVQTAMYEQPVHPSSYIDRCISEPETKQDFSSLQEYTSAYYDEESNRGNSNSCCEESISMKLNEMINENNQEDDLHNNNELDQYSNNNFENNNDGEDNNSYEPQVEEREHAKHTKKVNLPVATENAAATIASSAPTPPIGSNALSEKLGKYRNKARVAPGLGFLSHHPRNAHTFTASGQQFTLPIKYSLVKPIGTGAYGAVIAAKNEETQSSVAVKKISNIFDDLVDAKRILRETRLLGHFSHKNITKLLDLPTPPSRSTFEDMYIITELMETDLHQVIYSMQPMSDDHIKYFLYQILCALHHIHSAGVIHRDMKPSNILLNSNCDLKICDFGLARGGFPENVELTEYVVTRWYRAPEIMLNCLHYTASVDIWAVGCILAEMIQREPLFPGNDYIHQLKLIIKFLGTPKQDDIEFVKNSKALRFLTKLPIYKAHKFEEAFLTANPLAIDLLQKMLVFNPAHRISVLDALHHPYLQSFFDHADLNTSTLFDFEFDIPDDKLTKPAIIDLLCMDIAKFHPDIDNWE